jgi:hypothetical protein
MLVFAQALISSSFIYITFVFAVVAGVGARTRCWDRQTTKQPPASAIHSQPRPTSMKCVVWLLWYLHYYLCCVASAVGSGSCISAPVPVLTSIG